MGGRGVVESTAQAKRVLRVGEAADPVVVGAVRHAVPSLLAVRPRSEVARCGEVDLDGPTRGIGPGEAVGGGAHKKGKGAHMKKRKRKMREGRRRLGELAADVGRKHRARARKISHN